MEQRYMHLRILIIAIVFVFCQACSNASLKAEKSKPAVEGIKQASPQSAELAPDVVTYEIKEGDNILTRVKKITVKDAKGKSKNLGDLFAGKDILLVMVKPGCVFCESMLAVMNTTKPVIKPTLVVALDASHTTMEQFKEKVKHNKDLKATWIYDQDNKLHSDLGLVSFPRLVHLNKKTEVVHNQIGLVVPADKGKLEGEPFPVILQKLSEETIRWMQSLS